jgi:phosphoribosylaminoimidazolecarboxamide formyltransferase/IMP cyclohydrolase
VSTPDVRPVRHALFSLSDRTGAAALARALVEHGATLWATEGTAAFLAAEGVATRPVSDLVGRGSWLGGRVKTLHPSLLGGVLARRDVAADMEDLAAQSIPAFDLVACTLYPFESLTDDAPWAAAVETVDVGGVTLLRAAAKNAEAVAVLSDPMHYAACIAALVEAGGLSRAHRLALARDAFARTSRYDVAIARRFAREAGGDTAGPPAAWLAAFRRVRTLRYGENPHQEAALYAPLARGGGDGGDEAGVDAVLEGKELSFNNLVDLAAARALVSEFAGPTCVIVKHNEPAGVARGETAAKAFARAFEADALSAFGGVVAFNVEVDAEAAQALARPFLECVVAPAFAPLALDALRAKKNLRLVRAGATTPSRWEARPLGDDLLVQGVRADAPALKLEVVTRRAPTPAEMEALLFAWTVAGRARSNAIVIARVDRSLGVGSGQTSRIDALDVALLKARRSGHDTKGAVLASDGFFPFADWVAPARAAGIVAAIQPGGSLRDPESIEACDQVGLAMVLTGRRLFRH